MTSVSQEAIFSARWFRLIGLVKSGCSVSYLSFYHYDLYRGYINIWFYNTTLNQAYDHLFFYSSSLEDQETDYKYYEFFPHTHRVRPSTFTARDVITITNVLLFVSVQSLHIRKTGFNEDLTQEECPCMMSPWSSSEHKHFEEPVT